MQNWLDLTWDALPSFLATLDLPTVPAAAWVGLALLVAVWLGERMQRMGASRTTGYWLCGAGIGMVVAAVQWHVAPAAMPAVAGAITNTAAANAANTAAAASPWAFGVGSETVSSMAAIAQALFNLALGWVLVELGQRIDWRWLWRNKALTATAVLEFALTWGLAAAVLRSLDIAWLPAGVMATLVAHSSPVMLASLQQQWRAQGQVTERALHVGSINTVLTVIMLPLILSLASAYVQGANVVASGAGATGATLSGAINNPTGVTGLAGTSGISNISQPIQSLRSGLELAQPLWEVVASVAWGYALGWLLSRLGTAQRGLPGRGAKALSSPMVASFSSEWIYLAGAVCLAVGCAQWWGIPALVACLALGLSLRTRAVHAHAHDSHAVSALAQVLMFLVAGASLPWLAWAGLSANATLPALSAEALVLAALLLVIRLAAKTLVCTLTARWAGLRWPQGLALGMMLQPLSMTGLVLWGMAASVLTGPLAMLSLAYLLMLCVSDVLAPWAMQMVLRNMREVEPEPEPIQYSGLQTQSTVRPHRIDTESLPPSLPDMRTRENTREHTREHTRENNREIPAPRTVFPQPQ